MPHPSTTSSDHSNRADSSGGPADSGSFLSQFGQTTESTEFFSPHPEGYVPGRTAYVAVLGTVMSGLGKGIFSSSLAKLLKDKGLTVAPIKLEGYLNIDSGTLNPYRHGEVFVLEDGSARPPACVAWRGLQGYVSVFAGKEDLVVLRSRLG